MARSTHRNEALTTSSKSGCAGKLGLVLFFGIFLAVGSFFTYLVADSVVMPYIRSGNFAQVPCKITDSHVSDVMKKGSKTYSAEIAYDYEYQGQKYHSDKTGFSDSSGSWKSPYQAVVDRYPIGSEQVCFVDPEKPDYAVLERKWSWMFLILCIPGLFVLVGLGGIIGVLMPSSGPKRNQYYGTTGSINSQNKLDYGDEAEPSVVANSLDMMLKNQPFPLYDHKLSETARELPTMTSPLMLLGCAVFIALFWNGITWPIFLKMLQDKAGFFGLLFMSLFLLIGLGFIGWVFYQFLALFNPKPVLTISRSLLPLGSSSDLTWKFSSTPTSMSQLVIKLIGEEEAQYRRGTDTVTDKKTFYETVLFESFDPTAMEQGTINIEIPDRSMHTFMASHNKIRWKLTLNGTIPKWPDVMHDYELMVCPHAPQ